MRNHYKYLLCIFLLIVCVLLIIFAVLSNNNPGNEKTVLPPRTRRAIPQLTGIKTAWNPLARLPCLNKTAPE